MKKPAIRSRFRILALLLSLACVSVGVRYAMADGGVGTGPIDKMFTPTPFVGPVADTGTVVFNSPTFHVPLVKASLDTAPPVTRIPYKGVHVVVTVSARTAPTVLAVQLQQLDRGTGQWVNEPGATVTNITSTPISEDMIIYPGVTTVTPGGSVTGSRTSDAGFGVDGFRVQMTLTSSGSTTAAVTAGYIP